MTALHKPTLPMEEVEYPESDGQPMAETDFHYWAITELVDRLERRYQDQNEVYVAANNFVYFKESVPSASLSPDVYVVFGVPKGKRRTYKVWKEGAPPAITFEMTSRSTRREDQGDKMAKCARIGVREYWLFDPELDYLEPALQGYRLRGGRYRPIEPEADGGLRSEVLGVTLRLDGPRLLLHDTESGEPVTTAAEADELARQALNTTEADRRVQRRRAERAEAARWAEREERLHVEAERRAEHDARTAAEAEIARLRAELERLRGDGADGAP